jgi:guanine deaminase
MALDLEGAYALHGTIIHSISPSEIEIMMNTLLIIDGKGKIAVIRSDVWPGDGDHDLNGLVTRTISHAINDSNIQMPVTYVVQPYQFIVPSFIDTHVHAPQFSMRGLGQGMHILDWLDKITFPHEAKFDDNTYATFVYNKCVAMGLQQGVTTACYFSSLHTATTKTLADVCLALGQRAFIGKTCMDHPTTNASYYREETMAAVQGTEEVIEHCKAIDPKGDIIRPILTPRFAISCTPNCLTALGALAKDNQGAYKGQGIMNQTHFCEAQQEIDATLTQYSGFSCEADLYAKHGLLNQNSVLAHCTLLSDEDFTKISEQECGIAHCPISNVTVGGGFMAAPLRKLLSAGMTKIGLGTDSGGGFSCSILEAMRQAIIVGNAREMLSNGAEKRLSLDEVFYMATLGGARCLRMEDRIGSFEVGRNFDAILVDMDDLDIGGSRSTVGQHAMVDWDERDRTEENVRTIWEKWIMSGDDRNLRIVWVNGQERKNSFRPH